MAMEGVVTKGVERGAARRHRAKTWRWSRARRRRNGEKRNEEPVTSDSAKFRRSHHLTKTSNGEGEPKVRSMGGSKGVKEGTVTGEAKTKGWSKIRAGGETKKEGGSVEELSDKRAMGGRARDIKFQIPVMGVDKIISQFHTVFNRVWENGWGGAQFQATSKRMAQQQGQHTVGLPLI
ncbi:hypothetical protein BC829DRAFT_417817 [Chytridium lagenaria]|nr:hypothetical protein BC829DRAFT_417817 [Chytridium lagenaria]